MSEDLREQLAIKIASVAHLSSCAQMAYRIMPWINALIDVKKLEARLDECAWWGHLAEAEDHTKDCICIYCKHIEELKRQFAEARRVTR